LDHRRSLPTLLRHSQQNDGDRCMKSILEEADELINGDRAKEYGHPSVNFQRIANLWTSHLQNKPVDQDGTFELTCEDVAWMMMQVKQARAMEGLKRDTIVDAAGYIGIIELLNNSQE